MHRRHPNPEVGSDPQAATTSFCAVTGFLIVIVTFFPAKLFYYPVFRAIAAGIIIPWSIRDPYRIRRDRCEGVIVEEMNP